MAWTFEQHRLLTDCNALIAQQALTKTAGGFASSPSGLTLCKSIKHFASLALLLT